MLRRLALTIPLLFGISAPALGQDHGRHLSPYAGQEIRKIKSLSAERVADLLAGRGAGYAKAAELNGVPGPAHVLEMKDGIALTADQVRRVRALHARMKREARNLGTQLVTLESELNDAFASTRLTPKDLRSRLTHLGRAESALRFVHLAAHLETLDILTLDQIRLYNRLRGYAADPCTSVPEGHDANLWKRHNSCP